MTAYKLPASILPLTVIKGKIVVSPTQVIHLCSLPPQKKNNNKEEHYQITDWSLDKYSYGVNM